MIRNILAVITGHGPFKVDLQTLKLAKETDCPKCGQDSSTALHNIMLLLQGGKDKEANLWTLLS